MAIQRHGTSASTFPGNTPGGYVPAQGALFYTGAARDISLYYIGYFSQSIISSQAETLRLQLEKTEVPSPVHRKLFCSFIEMRQNKKVEAYLAEPSHRDDAPATEIEVHISLSYCNSASTKMLFSLLNVLHLAALPAYPVTASFGVS